MSRVTALLRTPTASVELRLQTEDDRDESASLCLFIDAVLVGELRLTDGECERLYNHLSIYRAQSFSR